MKLARERIQAIREERGLSREQLARKLRKSRRWVWRKETGESSLLAEELPLFARALDCDVAELVA